MIQKLKNLLPSYFIILLNKIRFKILHRRFRDLDNKKIFTDIYTYKLWNKNSTLDFDSGTGSHEEILTIEREGIGYLRTFLYERQTS